ncbi:MAG: DUF4434 domain-containing protein, partial [Proteiniphilum sp.]|nr:DUF4434 domain-containing protein [Proteiniphilum sp.]
MMKNSRRDFIKRAAVASAASVPLISSCTSSGEDASVVDKPSSNNILNHSIQSKLIVPKSSGLQITGTFLDEITHDIPHQNWGEAEWDLDFQHMKNIGIDTVIMIRSGYKKFITYPSKYLLNKGCYMPSVDLLDMYLRLAEKYGMKFYFGLYYSGHYWATG